MDIISQGTRDQRLFWIYPSPDIKTVKDCDGVDGANVELGYIVVDDSVCLYLMKYGEHRHLLSTGQGNSALLSLSIDPSSAAFFDKMWPFTEGNRIQKTVYLIRFFDVRMQLEVYGEKLEGLTLLRFFPRDSGIFALPEWVDRERNVTGLREFEDSCLAINGLPQIYRNMYRYESKGGK